MKIKAVRFQDFTVFADATLEFCSGVNVLIGENATGKSHVLKALYAICEKIRRDRPMEGMQGDLAEIFLPDQYDVARLIRRGSDPERASIEVQLDRGTPIEVEIRRPRSDAEGPSVSHLLLHLGGTLPRAIFLPPREVISIYPGFISAYERRHSSFDRTYYDLCVALNDRLLRKVPEASARLLARLERLLGGTVVFETDHFYVDLPEGKMEMPLLAEGLRKIATIAYLLLNGSLEPGGFLFWDEPEANMNPRLVVLLKELLLGFAQAGMQVFLATHDFLLSDELSLAAKYEGQGSLVRFFALTKTDAGVQVETGADLGELKDNPIVAEFGAHYDREARLFASATGGQR